MLLDLVPTDGVPIAVVVLYMLCGPLVGRVEGRCQYSLQLLVLGGEPLVGSGEALVGRGEAADADGALSGVHGDPRRVGSPGMGGRRSRRIPWEFSCFPYGGNFLKVGFLVVLHV